MRVRRRVNKRYITGFDGLRSLGVIAVILYHLNPDVFQGGYLGVPIFMVISGYLITDHLLMELQATDKFSFKHFWIKRIKRLYPALLAMLLASSAYIVLFQRNLLENLHRIFIANILYVYNWWQIANGQSYFDRFANNESPFTHMWTLSIEGQFYLFWPLLILLLWHFTKKKGAILWASLVLATVSAVLMGVLFSPTIDPSRVYYGTDTRMFSILIGCALAVVWPSSILRANIEKVDRVILDIIGLVGLVGIIWFMIVLNAKDPFVYRGGMVIFSIFVAMITASVAHPGSDWNRALSNPIFSWIGSRSYGLYLYQFPIMIFFESKFSNIADHPILYPLIQVILIFLVSEFFYRTVEKTFSHFSIDKIKEWFKQLFLGQSTNRAKGQLLIGLLLALVSGLGVAGLIQAPAVKANTANQSELAKRINKNAKDTSEQNAKLAASIKSQQAESKKAASDKSLSESISRSSSISSSKLEAEAAKTAVNSDLQAYGLTQVELHAAQNLSITAVGDSVMLGSAEGYKRIFPKMYLSASVSQQVYQIPPKIKSIVDQGLMAQNVLIGLGTNGSFRPAVMDQIMSTLGTSRNVFWINVHVPSQPWQNRVNEDLVTASHKYSNLHIIDWYDYAKDHPDWFSSDHVHPNPKGSPFYYSFVAKSLLTTLADKNK